MKDLNATGGLVEYNLGGTATQLGGQFSYSQRGPNVDVWLSQHPFQPDRFGKELKGFYYSNGIRFADSANAWTRNRIGTEVEVKGPYAYGSPLRYEVVFEVYREQIADQKTTRPPNGYYVGIAPEIAWDQYHWHDLVPKGYRLTLELRPGYFLGPHQARHEARLRYLQGIPLASTTVLMINSVAEAVNNSGNPNHSLLLGSITGVRGLSDNLYRNRAQAYTNLEFRHAIPLAPRWALQGVMFSDLGYISILHGGREDARLARCDQCRRRIQARPDLPGQYSVTRGFCPPLRAEPEFPHPIWNYAVFLEPPGTAERGCSYTVMIG